MSRYRASLIHLLISAVLVGCVVAVVFWVWYPGPAFEAVGALAIVLLLVFVHLGIGPLLTLIVFRHDKPSLKFDLTVIAFLQIAALAYGSYRLYDERPHYLVFSVDRLEFVSGKRIEPAAIRYDELRTGRFAELIPVYARSPEDPEEQQRFLESVVLEGKADLESRAEYWEPWAAGVDAIRDKLTPIGEIRAGSAGERASLQRAIDDYSEDHPELGVLPVGSVRKDIGMILDRETLEILGVLDVNPWPSTTP